MRANLRRSWKMSLLVVCVWAFCAGSAAFAAEAAESQSEMPAADGSEAEMEMNQTDDMMEVSARGYTPPVYTEPRLSLLDAVRLTLEHQPDIRLSKTDVMRQRGVAMEAAGPFDPVFQGQLSYEYTLDELPDSQIQGLLESRKRIRQAIQVIEEELERIRGRAAEYERARTVLETGGNLDSVTFSDPADQAQWDMFRALVNHPDPNIAEAARQMALRWAIQTGEGLREEEDALEEEAADQRKRLRDLGTAPDARESQTGQMQLNLSKTFRTGSSLSTFFNLSGNNANFVGKPNDTDRGGQGQSGRYQAQLGFEVAIPLGRGRGEAATGAQERAAGIQAAAAEQQVADAAAQAIFQTMQAYWQLVAAQQTYDVRRDSVVLNNELVSMMDALVEAGEIPSIELTRSRARTAEAQASLAESERSLHEARVNLAKTIGLKVEELGAAPLARDSFPAGVPPNAVETIALGQLMDTSLQRRPDYAAQKQLRSAAEALWDAAKINLKPRVDFTTRVWYSGIGEDKNVFSGVSEAVIDKVGGPSTKLSLETEWPFYNDTQKGLLEQQRARLNQELIRVTDLERTIQSNIVSTVGQMSTVLQQLSDYADAAEHYETTVDAEIEKFKQGIGTTLLDVVVSEQRQLSARTTLIQARLRYANLLAQLRFETGSLVSESEAGKLITYDNLLTIPSASR